MNKILLVEDDHLLNKTLTYNLLKLPTLKMGFAP